MSLRGVPVKPERRGNLDCFSRQGGIAMTNRASFCKILVLVLFMTGVCFCIETEKFDVQSVFSQANKNYEDAKYEEAISNYESLISSGISDSRVYFNLGNSYFRSNSVGKAILNYEKALKLSPRDEDTKFNLNFLRTFIKEPDEGLLYRLVTSLTINEITVACSLIYLLLFVSLILSLFYKIPRLKTVNISAGLLLFVCLVWWYGIYSAEIKTERGIVISAPAEARTGPGDDYSVGFTLPEGKKVVVLSEKDNWYAIAVKQAESEGVMLKGWIKKDIIAKI